MESKQPYLIHRNKHRKADKMRRQRNVSQKNRTKLQKKELNKMEKSNLPDAKFKALLIRMLRELRRRVDELR